MQPKALCHGRNELWFELGFKLEVQFSRTAWVGTWSQSMTLQVLNVHSTRSEHERAQAAMYSVSFLIVLEPRACSRVPEFTSCDFCGGKRRACASFAFEFFSYVPRRGLSILLSRFSGA